MNANEAAAILREMQATWPQRSFDEPQTVVWMQTLEPFPADAARAAVLELRQTLTFMPSHAEFRDRAEHHRKRLLAHRALPAGDHPCPECDDVTMVVLNRSLNIVRPCRRCRTVEWERWASGHFARGHTCADCVDFREGNKDSVRSLAEHYRTRAANREAS